MPAPQTAKTPIDNLREASRAAVARVNVALPVSVLSYDSTTQKVTVRIAQSFYRKNADGDVEAYRPPDIPGVPVAFPGAGDFSITWPLAAGDTGIIVVADRSMDEWKVNGRTTVEQQDKRRHNLLDAVFIPGLRSYADAVPAAGVDGSAMVIRGAEIKLGSSAATSFVALATLVDAQFSALSSALSSWTPVPTDGGAALKTILTALIGGGWPASTAASKVKAE